MCALPTNYGTHLKKKVINFLVILKYLVEYVYGSEQFDVGLLVGLLLKFN